jgi:hypothetical protein
LSLRPLLSKHLGVTPEIKHFPRPACCRRQLYHAFVDSERVGYVTTATVLTAADLDEGLSSEGVDGTKEQAYRSGHNSGTTDDGAPSA